jgi:hypothetical protein
VQQGKPARSDVAVAERVTPLLWPGALAGYGWLPGADVVTAETVGPALCRADQRRTSTFPAWLAEITFVSLWRRVGGR